MPGESTEMLGAARPRRASSLERPRLEGCASAVRAGLRLALANVRYWSTVSPLVREQLTRWAARADAIADDELRELALAKLEHEGFNAEAGAMLATFAPRPQRANVVEAIVALQVLFDLLDGLSERLSPDPLGDGQRLFLVFTDALRYPSPAAAAAATTTTATAAPASASGEQDGYLRELSEAASRAFTRLPAGAAVAQVAQAGARRAAEAQIRMHAAPTLGRGQLESWAQTRALGTGLGWREFAAGAASSVLAIHALAAAAAHPHTTAADAAQLDGVYLPTCALLTLLDSLTDREQDARGGEQGFIDLYDDPEQLGQALLDAAELALRRTKLIADGAEHELILTGVVAYYSSTRGARSELARPLLARVHRSLPPLIAPTWAVMRIWRLMKEFRTLATRRPRGERGLSSDAAARPHDGRSRPSRSAPESRRGT